MQDLEIIYKICTLVLGLFTLTLGWITLFRTIKKENTKKGNSRRKK